MGSSSFSQVPETLHNIGDKTPGPHRTNQSITGGNSAHTPAPWGPCEASTQPPDHKTEARRGSRVRCRPPPPVVALELALWPRQAPGRQPSIRLPHSRPHTLSVQGRLRTRGGPEHASIRDTSGHTQEVSKGSSPPTLQYQVMGLLRPPNDLCSEPHETTPFAHKATIFIRNKGEVKYDLRYV